MAVQHVQHIGMENGRQVYLTYHQYRVLYYAMNHQIIAFYPNYWNRQPVAWKLRWNDELITATVNSLLRRKYLEKKNGSVRLTMLGRLAMKKYWGKRKEAEGADGDIR